jgi:glucan phosphoethanolaminetransferase (alkaline phosphatase superfamily)
MYFRLQGSRQTGLSAGRLDAVLCVVSVMRISPLFVLIGLHLCLSAAAQAAFTWQFGQNPRAIATHLLVIAEWDLVLLAVCRVAALSSLRVAAGADALFRLLLAVMCTAQVYLYALNVISNLSWGRNMTAHLVAAFAPTVWSGREPFLVGARGITAFGFGTLAVALLALRGVVSRPQSGNPAVATWRGLGLAIAAAAGMALVVGVTVRWGIEGRDSLFWKHELVSSFFRAEGFAFEPSARRHAVAARDASLRAAYPHVVPGARPKHVVLIIVDSLRADRMNVYGYQRPTTPFLSQMVHDGRMKRVEAAFSTCSESFCGITSTLASRDFLDISARTFQLQDVLHDQGYQSWFVLSGNHRAWNGLPSFYHVSEDRFFDGSQTRRFTMDDDRLVLEGLDAVPAATPGQPAFFYLHLMSTHYLGVQFPESHVFTRPDDVLSAGLEPYKIRDQLNKPDRYDDKVRQADGVIRRIFEMLETRGYLDDAVVVITGDHGEGLGERHWAHGWHLYDEDIRIPMLIYDVPAATYPDLTFATQVDIAPTILDRLGLPIPASWAGQSLLAATPRRFTHHQTYFAPNRFAVLYRDERSLVKFIATPQYGTEELYDLTADKREAQNLVKEHPQLASLLRDKVRAYRAGEP